MKIKQKFEHNDRINRSYKVTQLLNGKLYLCRRDVTRFYV